MRLALLFSGQGQQTSEHLALLRDKADISLSQALVQSIPDVWSLSDDGDRDLSINVVAQPMIFAFQMAWWQQLAPHLPPPICAAGYSLGEMAACAAAGLFSAEAGVLLCRRRAELMDKYAPAMPVTMLAVLGLSEPGVRAVASRFDLALAIRNSPDHFVVTGSEAAIQNAINAFELAGASKLTGIAVKTPSHTPWLDAASAAFRDLLAELMREPLAFPVVSAIDGRLSYAAENATKAVAAQISSMLHWDSALETIVEMRPDVVLEIGPGSALTKMLSEVAPELPARSVNDFKTVEGVLAWLKRMA